jgi:cytochrome c
MMRLVAGVLVAAVAFATGTRGGGFVTLEGHGGPVRSVTVSTDGRMAATTSFDNSAGLWDAEHARNLRWLEGHDAAVNAAAFTPDGRVVVTASDDFDLIVWDVATGRTLYRLEGHRGKLLSVAIAPGGVLAASAGWDGRIGLWNIATGERVAFLEGHRSNVNSVVFSGDGETLWSASYDGTIRRWRVAERKLDRIAVRHGFGVNLLALNEPAGWLAYGAVDGVVRIIDIETGAEIADITSGRQPVLGLALSADGARLAVSDGEGWIHVVATGDWTTVREFHAVPRGPIWGLAFAGDGERLMSAGVDNVVHIWPIDEARSVAASDRPFAFKRRAGLSAGEGQFVRKCSICHSLRPDGVRRAGPTLHGLFGRPAGSVAGFAYSRALANADIIWNADTIDTLFALGPDRYTPGSKMPMQRIANGADRADLIAYLREATRPGGDTR